MPCQLRDRPRRAEPVPPRHPAGLQIGQQFSGVAECHDTSSAGCRSRSARNACGSTSAWTLAIAPRRADRPRSRRLRAQAVQPERPRARWPPPARQRRRLAGRDERQQRLAELGLQLLDLQAHCARRAPDRRRRRPGCHDPRSRPGGKHADIHEVSRLRIKNIAFLDDNTGPSIAATWSPAMGRRASTTSAAIPSPRPPPR